MIVTFCGHAQFHKAEEYEQILLAFLEEKIGDQAADMYLGGYGGFDSFAHFLKYSRSCLPASRQIRTSYIINFLLNF